MKRSIKILLGVVLATILVGAVAIFFLDTIVRTSVEKVGPMVTKVPVKLDSATISIFGGSGKLKGFVIGNPEGFKSPHAIKVGNVDVALAPASLFSDKVIVRRVHVEAPEITYETDLKGSNLGKLLDNVRGAEQQQGTTATNDPATAKKLQVDDFVIKGGRVHVSSSLVGGQSMTVPLPDIHLTNLGTGPDGITPAELSKRILSEVLDATTKAAAGGAAQLKQGITDGAKTLGTTASDQLQKSASGIGDLFKKKTN